ncbi:hypothetical protein G1H11_14625 [Phytoactinopolyspora alkaliphila]|uniref:Gamma-glutamyltransferase n=1 Tax=Phytoactinopolyspora alkaliphila TaxID=1783498 RepID=A0A6N9YNJ4_9ACTN|nr:gamma-glutamyltransferase [Phytoactinopolyspora alkaliphila]NED96542.1 hypothetical protein [Phytoactinopolyspora alkaliphila]
MRRNRPLTFAPLSLLPAGALLATSFIAAVPSAADPPPYPQSPTATGYGGAAATEHPLATQAAMDALDAGGNAIDAAITASAVQSVVRPFSGGIGGGGYLHIYLEDTDEFVVIDHRSAGAASFDENALVDPLTGEDYDEEVRTNSGPAFGVPGVVKAWEEAIADYGSGVLTFEDILQPAIDVAASGFIADENYIREVSENADRFCIFPATAAIYLDSGCAVPAVGSLVTNADLAATLELIADHGSTVFYDGEIADAVVDTINDPETVPTPPFDVLEGDLALTDFTGYQTYQYQPVSVDYRGYQVYGAPPSSSGGTTVGQALKILEGYDLAAAAPEEALHYYLEASRHAFADQGAYLGDPTTYSGTIPVDGLLSDNYAEQVRQRITENGVQRVINPADPWPFDADPNHPVAILPAAGGNALNTDFSGLANGSSWAADDAFTTTNSAGTASSVEIQGETGEIHLDPGQYSYARADSSMTPTANSELLVRFKIDDFGGDRRLRFWLRSDEWNNSTSPHNGYAVEINSADDTVRFIRTRDGNAVHGLASFPHVRSTDWQWLRFSVDGDQLTMRIWPDDEPEPRQEWTGELTDTSVSGSGSLLVAGIELSGASSGGGFSVDDVRVTELDPAAIREPFAGVADDSTWDSTGLFSTQFGNGASNPGVGAAIDVQDEVGRLSLDTSRYSYARAQSLTPELLDSELLVKVNVRDLGDDRRLRLWLRGDEWNTLVAPNYGYGIEIRSTTDPAVDNVRLLRVRHGNSPYTLTSTRRDLSTGALWLRFRVNGNGISARVWDDGDPEPLDWTFQRTDLEVTEPGSLMIGGIESTGSGSGGEFLLEDLTLFDHDAIRDSHPPAASSQTSGTTAGTTAGGTSVGDDPDAEDASHSTIHLTVTDADGNVVAYTHTLSAIGGNGMVVPGYGFLLNNELSGRTPTNAPVGHPNGPRGGMRPVSTQAPTIVMHNGEPVMALGSPGGGTIVTTVLQVLINTLDLGMSLPDAVAAPRLSQRNHSALGQTLVEPEFTLEPEYQALRERGHDFFVTGLSYGIGAVNAVAFLPDGRVQAVSEPMRRGGGSAMVETPSP